MSNVLIIDYGMGNLQSVKRAFEECGAEAFISDDPRELKSATHIVLPGVGSFHDGMQNLAERGWPSALRNEIENENIPLLGICLGMQLLASHGSEGGTTTGLNLVPGEVIKFEPDKPSTRIPHVGWNEIYPAAGNKLFENIATGTDYYFVHSYYFKPSASCYAAATTPYCGKFTSAVSNENVYGVQFHPEKSQKNGFQIIRNFLSIN